VTYGIDLLADEATGDLNTDGNDFNFVATTSQSLRQRIELRVNTWQGEWAFNTAFGLPVRQRIMTQSLTKSQIDAEYIAQINLEPDVTGILNIQSDIDRNSRDYKLNRVEVYTDEGSYDLGVINPDEVKYSYPKPAVLDELNVCIYDGENIEISDKLYGFLNHDLPYTGISTWWNIWSGNAPDAPSNYVDGDYIDDDYVEDLTTINRSFYIKQGYVKKGYVKFTS